MKTILKSAIAVAALVAPLASFSTVASAGKAPSHTYVAACDQTKLYKPVNMGINCKNANEFLSKMVWTSWKSTSATGTGRLVSKTTSSGTYTLSGVVTKNGVKYFTTISGPGLSKPAALPKP